MAKGNSKRKNINGNDIELLVPAGGTEQFLAAVENGADAIYVGGQLFNARAGAQNFNDDELVLALDYAHKRGVKVYVTMNTLLSDDELEPALRYASFLHDSGVDAIIVQDLGLGELVHRALPDLELHMSTQATITDVGSAKVAHELGYKRIVVARELALRRPEWQSGKLRAALPPRLYELWRGRQAARGGEPPDEPARHVSARSTRRAHRCWRSFLQD